MSLNLSPKTACPKLAIQLVYVNLQYLTLGNICRSIFNTFNSYALYITVGDSEDDGEHYNCNG